VTRAFSNTAHAVNNALQVVSGSAELLEAAGGLPPPALRRVQAIRTQSGRAAAAIDGLLSYARGAGPRTASLDLCRILDLVIELRAHSLSRARITVAFTRPEEGSCVILAEPGKLVQLLLNLLLMVEAEVAVRADARIGIAAERLPSHVRLVITAQGPPSSRTQASPAGFLGFENSAQERVVRRLADGMAGRLTIERSDDDGVRSIELTLSRADKQV
jgi:C4-dicarboxylate-specific signal transduction histidine kinase